MLQKASFLAKIGADRAKNERNVAEMLPIGVLDVDDVFLTRRGGAASRTGAKAAWQVRECLCNFGVGEYLQVVERYFLERSTRGWGVKPYL